MKSHHVRHLFWLMMATLFISTSGSLGRYIDMPTPVTIWWRSSLAAVFLGVFCLLKGIKLNSVARKDYRSLFLSSVFMGLHWITYFYALQLSSVAIGMLSLFTFPTIIAFLEPYFSNVKFDPFHIVLGIMVIIGIYILAPDFDFNDTQLQGLLWGLFSALCYALRTLLLKNQASRYSGTLIMFYQVMILTILLGPFLLFLDASNIKTQFPYVLLLAVLTTAIGHSLFVRSLGYFKVSTASIIGSIQPIFGILIAFVFLDEVPKWNAFWGGFLILTAAIIESTRSKKQMK